MKRHSPKATTSPELLNSYACAWRCAVEPILTCCLCRQPKKTELYEAEYIAALAANKRPPDPPVANCYQLAKIADGYIYTYLPPKHAEAVFRIATAYQTEKISRHVAIEKTQVVADAVWEELGVIQKFQVLQFLIDENDESASGFSLSTDATKD